MRMCDVQGCQGVYGHRGSHNVNYAAQFPGYEADEAPDMVNPPPHYTSDPSGVECITITRHRTFNVGNAIKYLWRAGLKGDAAQESREKQLEDLRKAVWYITDEIGRLEAEATE